MKSKKSLLRKKKAGRPAGSREHIREKLLDAAVTLFSQAGAAATPTSRIAAQVGVTPAMAHYYFTNREQLFDAVVSERMMRFVDCVWDRFSFADPDAPLLPEDVGGLIRSIVEASKEMPWMPGLWVREIIADNATLRDRMIRRVQAVQLQAFARRLVAGQDKGLINSRLDPLLSILSILGATLLPLSLIAVRTDDSPPVMTGETITNHATALLLPGFLPETESTDRRGTHE